MRAAAVIATLALASLNTAAEDAIWNRAAAYQAALTHVAKIDGPRSSRIIEIQTGPGSQRREQLVSIRGQISATAVAQLVRLHLGSNKRYFLEAREWAVDVVGDSRFATVRADNQCREFCG